MDPPYQVVSLPDSPSILDRQRLTQAVVRKSRFFSILASSRTPRSSLRTSSTPRIALLLNAAQVAVSKQQSKKTDRRIAHQGFQAGRGALKNRQFKVNKPKLRKRTPKPGEPGEVEIPDSEAMHKGGRHVDRMLEILNRQGVDSSDTGV